MFLKKLSSGLYVILPATSPTSADRVSYPLNDKRWLSSPERIVCGGEWIHYYYHVAALSVMMRCPITLRWSMGFKKKDERRKSFVGGTTVER